MKLARKTGESALGVVDYAKCEENGDSYYHERPVCVPEACDELS